MCTSLVAEITDGLQHLNKRTQQQVILNQDSCRRQRDITVAVEMGLRWQAHLYSNSQHNLPLVLLVLANRLLACYCIPLLNLGLCKVGAVRAAAFSPRDQWSRRIETWSKALCNRLLRGSHTTCNKGAILPTRRRMLQNHSGRG